MIKVGITQGDINGIGWEVIIKTFADPTMLELCTPVIFGSNKTCSYHRKTLSGVDDFNFTIIRDAEQAQHKKVNLVNIYEEEVAVELGKPTQAGGTYALKSLEAACDAIQHGKLDVLVTAPINKHNIQSDLFKFPGHTEYLQMRFGQNDSLMFMCSDNLRVGVVSGHVPLANVAANITIEKIISKLRIMNQSLQRDFGIRKPKIAVLGLNPHAGDNGTIGAEEQSIIIPAINKLKEENTLVYGPYSADGFFGSNTYSKFDAVLGMYHDQGLVPFKSLSFNEGVNYTAGLSIIRTSPDHGTAYDIAGQNKANENSFRKAVYMALDIYRKRSEFDEITADPLKSTPMKKERG
ncbi:MAG TPA: 4-hydroxythreonine-4-phosphate dehydrogenase PdxA [Bacteroidia bacterium]